MFLAVARKFFLKRHPHTRFPYRHQEKRRPSGPISRSFTETDTVKPTGSRKRSAQGVSEGSSPECRDAEAVPVYRRLHLPTPTDRGGPKSISCAHSPPAKALGVTAELGGLLAPSLRPKYCRRANAIKSCSSKSLKTLKREQLFLVFESYKKVLKSY